MKIVLDGKRTKIWAFVLTLSYSRHRFIRFVERQDVATWLDCQILGFQFFGGVTATVQADLSYKFVGEIERGVVNPSFDSLLKIANALTIEVAELFLHKGLVVLTYDDVVRAESSLVP